MQAKRPTIRQTLAKMLRAVPRALEFLGWLLIFVGFPMGNTTVGLVVLFLGGLVRLLTRQTFAWGLPRNDRLYRWAWIFLALTVVSALQSSDPLLGLSVSLAFSLMFVLLTMGSSNLVGPEAYFSLHHVAYVVLSSGAIASVYAMYTYFGLGHYRASGISIGINGLGTVSAFLCIVALGYAVHIWRQNRIQAVLGVVTSVTALGALAVTFSRGAWLGFAFSLGLLFVLQLMAQKIRWTTLVTLIIIASLSIGAVTVFVPGVQKRFISSFQYEANMDRVVLWRAAIEMIRDNPLFGIGGGAFPTVYEEYRVEKGHEMAFAHNIVLQTGAEFGLLGLIAFSLLVGTAIVRGWTLATNSSIFIQALYCGYLGILVHDLVDNITYGMNMGGLFWLLTGLLVHLHYRMKDGLRCAQPGRAEDRVGV